MYGITETDWSGGRGAGGTQAPFWTRRGIDGTICHIWEVISQRLRKGSDEPAIDPHQDHGTLLANPKQKLLSYYVHCYRTFTLI